MTIGFAGLSHLGIVSSAAAASKGFDVVGYDPDAALCERLGRGELPIAEPGLPELFGANRALLRFSSSAGELAACDLIYVSIDVPTDRDNRSDLSPLRTLIATTLAHADPAAVLVILSQVPPGFTRALGADIASQSAEDGRPLYCQVETLAFGMAVRRALEPERYIVGCADPRAPLHDALARVLAAFDCPVLPVRYESAELAKISINMFLVSSISTANCLAELCERVGAEWSEIAPALRLDRRIGAHAYLAPGLGIAGGNLERDLVTVQSMAGEHGTDAGIVSAWLANSPYRRDWALRALHEYGGLKEPDSRLGVWGIAYKPDTASTKNSPATALMAAVRPVATRAYDPVATLPVGDRVTCSQVRAPLDACDGADALAVMTAWPEFTSVDLHDVRRRMRGRLLVDPLGVLDAQACTALGFMYVRLGSPLPC